MTWSENDHAKLNLVLEKDRLKSLSRLKKALAKSLTKMVLDLNISQ